MNQPQSNEYDLPDYDPDADVQFRQPPQVLAIVTLVLGCLCFVALFSTTMWIFPIAVIALGTASLVSLARDPTKIGRKAALIGVMCAVFFGAWATSRYFSRQQWLCQNARRSADIWLEIVKENRLREAHQLHLHKNQRVSKGVTMDEYYEKQEYAQSDYDAFIGGAPLSDFIKVAPQATVEFVRLDSYLPMKVNDNLSLRYVARYEQDGKPQELVMCVVMRRSVYSVTGECEWFVYKVVRPPDKP